MFERKQGAGAAASDAISGISPYVNQLAHDEKLRQRLLAAVSATAAARERARSQTGWSGVARRLASDPVLRAQAGEAVAQLQKAKGRVRKNRSHRVRNWVLLLVGGGLVVAAVPSLRSSLLKKLRGTGDNWAPQEWSDSRAGSLSATIEHEIEVEVPVSTAYNQWTQFEEFPRFMEGVESVEQLDDTLLHWAATVAGKKCRVGREDRRAGARPSHRVGIRRTESRPAAPSASSPPASWQDARPAGNVLPARGRW